MGTTDDTGRVGQSDLPTREEQRQNLIRATGTQEPELGFWLVKQAQGAVPLPPPPHVKGQVGAAMDAAVQALMAIAPRDPVEGMLATQMLAAHNAAMECLKNAAHAGGTRPSTDVWLRNAGKLMQLYLRQIEVLDRRRGLLPPKVTVGRVSVSDGGQAIVGHVAAKQD